MNNVVFRKIMENMRKDRDITLVTNESKMNRLAWKPKYHTTKTFSEHLLAIEMEMTQILMNKPVYLALAILEISRIALYEFWYHYVKIKYGEKANLCNMDTDSFIVYTKTEELSVDIVKDVKARFDTSNYELETPKKSCWIIIQMKMD